MIWGMVADYKQSANNALERSVIAKESSDRHSDDVAQMRKHATEAVDRLNKAEKRQRKRDAHKKPGKP